jgi:hypothetical protein
MHSILLAAAALASGSSLEGPAEKPDRPVSFTLGVGGSSILLFMPNFAVLHGGVDFSDYVTAEAYLGVGANYDDGRFMYRPGVQLRLYPGGDATDGFYLAPEFRVWGILEAASPELGGRLGHRWPAGDSFGVDLGVGLFKGLADGADARKDPQYGLVHLARVTADLWLYWRF